MPLVAKKIEMVWNWDVRGLRSKKGGTLLAG